VTLAKAGALLAAILVVSVAACDKSHDSRVDSEKAGGPAGRKAEAPAAQPPTPVDTVRMVHAHRLAGQTGLLQEYLLPAQRPHVVEFIQAIDRLVAADRVLKAAVTRHFGPLSTEAFDRSRAANAAGIFSRDVDVLDERIDGDTAEVTVQIEDRIPLEVVALVRRDGRWLIKTDPPVEGLAAEIVRLAQTLTDVARMLDKKPMTLAELKKELSLREASVGRRITALTKNP